MSGSGLVGLAEFPTEAEARDAGRELLERGIGCEIVDHPDGEARIVQVLPGDVERARKHLGLAPDAAPVAGGASADGGPAAGAGSPAAGGPQEGAQPAAAKARSRATTKDKYDDEGRKIHHLLGGRIEATTRQIVIAACIYVAALILIPTVAFLGTRWAVGSGSDAPEVPSSFVQP